VKLGFGDRFVAKRGCAWKADRAGVGVSGCVTDTVGHGRRSVICRKQKLNSEFSLSDAYALLE